MNANKNKKTVLETQPSDARPATGERYEAPRITRKHSLERVTLTSGALQPGGGIGGN